MTRFIAVLFAVLFAAALATAGLTAVDDPHNGPLFKTSDDWLACHNSLVTPSGEDVSIGASWRAR